MRIIITIVLTSTTAPSGELPFAEGIADYLFKNKKNRISTFASLYSGKKLGKQGIGLDLQ